MRKRMFKLGIFIGVIIISLGVILFFLKKINAPATMNNKINVTTSFYPLYFLTSQIGGDLVNVNNLTPAGTEPHDYELTARDIAKIKKSKLLILNGGGLEIWAESVKKNISFKNPLVVNLGEGLVSQEDPHIWLSPTLAIKMAEKISKGLIEVDSQNKSYYESNFNILKTKLVNLDSAYKASLADCQRKDIITSHSAFIYLAKDYGLRQISIAGLSPEEEPSSKQLADVTQFARDNNVKYIFFESLVSPKLSQTIAKEIGAKILILNPIEGLTEKELNQGRDYLTEMNTNLENLKIALECKNN
ncbi:MAG: zinc ABC transporter substrate-binding protein [Parcubacteria group bacterium]|jgi:zinc transport system substrate-binding protein